MILFSLFTFFFAVSFGEESKWGGMRLGLSITHGNCPNGQAPLSALVLYATTTSHKPFAE